MGVPRPGRGEGRPAGPRGAAGEGESRAPREQCAVAGPPRAGGFGWRVG